MLAFEDQPDERKIQVEIKGSQRPYDTANYDPRIVFEYGGYPSDKPFMGQGPPPPGGSFNQPPVWSQPPGPNGGMYGGQGGTGASMPVYGDPSVITTQVRRALKTYHSSLPLGDHSK